MTKPDARLILKAARNAAKRYTPAPLRHWQEDIASDVVLYVVARLQECERLGADCYRFAALHAVRRLCYLLRGQSELLDGVEVPEDAPHELAPLPLWRLQQVWEDLTDLQRLSVHQLLSGDGFLEVARGNGISSSSLARARATVLQRLNAPTTMPTRSRRSYQRVEVGTRAADPAAVAAFKEADKLRAREYRAAKRRAA